MIKRTYTFKVWGSTIIGAPVLMMLYGSVKAALNGDSMDAGAFGFIAFAVGYGLLLSLPTFLIIYFLIPWVGKKVEKPLQIKLFLTSIGIVCIWLTFYVLYFGDGYDLNGNSAALFFSILYTVCLTLFGFLYPIQRQERSDE